MMAIFVSFNRTFMELKRRSNMKSGFRKLGFNRTFMELKLLKIIDIQRFIARFNRTFMELKLHITICTFFRVSKF